MSSQFVCRVLWYTATLVHNEYKQVVENKFLESSHWQKSRKVRFHMGSLLTRHLRPTPFSKYLLSEWMAEKEEHI